jgi:protease IV
MSLIADQIVDRRHLAKRVSFWRIISVLLAIGLVAGLGIFAGGGTIATEHSKPHIARVSIAGLITGDNATLELLESVQKSPAVQGVILSIESPGGTVSGSEELYLSIRRLSEVKPVVSVVGNTAASGAYIAALGSDHIISRGGAIIGSIGVIAQIPNATKLLGNLGVEMETVRSSPLKASPSGLEPTPPEAKKALEAMILDSFVWFKGLVKERRKLSDEELKIVADGRVFTGRQALPLKLVDELGGEIEAKKWLETEKKISSNLSIEDWKRVEKNKPFNLLRNLSALSSTIGFQSLAIGLNQMAGVTEQAQHTGLMMIWTP